MGVKNEYEGKVLHMMVGLPYSGKTTKARKLGYPIVCPDAIRYAVHGQRYAVEGEPFVWAVAKAMVKALFLAGHNDVVLDATNTTLKRREEWRDDRWLRRYYFMRSGAEVCMKRARDADDQVMIPVIEKMDNQFESLEEVPHGQSEDGEQSSGG